MFCQFSEIYHYYQKNRAYPGKNPFFLYFEGYPPGETVNNSEGLRSAHLSSCDPRSNHTPWTDGGDATIKVARVVLLAALSV